MKVLVFIFCSFLLTSCLKEKQEPSLLGPGVSLDLANYRKTQVSDVVYDLSFHIPLEITKPIKSNLNLSLKINDLAHPLYLDFNVDTTHVKEVKANGVVIPVKHEQEHVIIDTEYLKIGTNTITVLFHAGELSLNRNDDYLYTLLVPDRASTLFPCFDQPNIKAHYILDVTAPKSWKVLCGSKVDFEEDKGENIRHKFVKSDLMSTYLFSFVAGVFNETHQELNNLKMHFLYRENDKEKIEASTHEIFKLHRESVAFLEDYTQYKFPFQKLDFAAIPGFQYGGMEHVGAIQYRESSLFLDENATQDEKLNRCQLIAHETSHMWFGDLVTMNWFDDVWLKEVFANFLADKISNPAFPDVNHTLNFMNAHYPSAYSEDRTQGATAIKQPLSNLKNAGTLYGNIIYHKAPIMMRQLETLLGEEPFRNGMRNYIKKFANSNADWNDLVSLLDAETEYDLKQWSDVWVHKSGRPIITDSISYNNNTIEGFTLKQQAEDGSTNIWPQTFSLGLVYDDSVKVVSVSLNTASKTLEHLKGLPKPKTVIYNYDAMGYGVFPIKASEISFIPAINDDVARGYSYINLYENVLTETINPEAALKVLIEGVSKENEELILNNILGSTSSIFWHFISSEKRDAFGKVLEEILLKRMQSAEVSASMKKTLFGLFKTVAYSNHGRDKLYQIWNKDFTIKNLNLNEDDYTSLACTLALYNYPDSDAILNTALQAVSNPDRKKRLEFLLPSLSQDPAVRDAFMASLAKPENREKESWVGSALYFINHPLRQQYSQKYLKSSLELVEEVQLTGDIFFPKAWLNATIGSYSSDYALEVLEQFLLENPDFPSVLKNKLLQSADNLYRAKQIRTTWP